MHFTKMHGQGNDFVVVDNDLGDRFPALSERICDRHMGVGADGLIAVLPSDTCDFKMRIFNADGSEPEMCGNGVRRAVQFFLDSKQPAGLDTDDGGRLKVSVETLAGVRRISADFSGGKTGDMTVDMGEPILDPRDIPVNLDTKVAVAVPVETTDGAYTVTCVSMGNPHAVIFTDEDPDRIDISLPGPAIENHPVFPNRTNVEFAKVLGPGEIKMRVWERGVGETLACGTGACATLVAASLNSLSGKSAVLHLAGGDLRIEWREDGRVYMSGPAAAVFEGEFFGG